MCVPVSGVNETCRVYMADEVGININVVVTWLRVVLTAP